MLNGRWFIFAIGMLLYLSTGIFIVPANEKAVVRRFGATVKPPRSSGLNIDLPWPFSRVDRVNVNEVRTMTLGDVEPDPNFLKATTAARPMMYLTGDRNLLLLRLTVQYRISEQDLPEWLYQSRSPTERLRCLIETITADLVSKCGVDFVHTQGLAVLNNRLLQDVRRQVSDLRLGCEIEQVTIDRAEPPARVKAEFLDVSNARADMVRTINDARSYAEQAVAESQADARRVTDDAERERHIKTSSAAGAADRFLKLTAQIHADAAQSGRSYTAARQLVMNRLALETFSDVFRKSRLKVVLDGERPFDLTIPK